MVLASTSLSLKHAAPDSTHMIDSISIPTSFEDAQRKVLNLFRTLG